MATNFGRNWQNDLYSAGWHSEANWTMAVLIQKYPIAIFSYILCKFDEDRSSNPKDYEGNNSLNDTAKIGISHGVL